MDAILGDLPFVFVYIDDILVASNSKEEHLQHLEEVFSILAANGLVVNRAKCDLGKPSLNFLGYRVDSNGIAPLDERVEAIRSIPPPTTVKELQRFLGMFNYYRRFVAHAAELLFPLFDCLKGKPRKLEWTAACNESFLAIKEALAQAAMLRHPRPGAPLAVTSDASDHAMGAVLEQRGPDGWEPLAFFSAKLEKNQQDWPPFDRELLAAFRSIRHFRHMVEGRSFTLYTDHQSLIPALHKKTEPQTARHTYQLANIAEYTTDIRYLEGKANSVADALSRPHTPVAPALLASITELETWSTQVALVNSISSVASSTTRQPASAVVPSSTDSIVADSSENGGANAAQSSRVSRSRQAATPISSVEQTIPGPKLQELARVVASIEPLGLDLAAMAREQPLDPDLVRLSEDPNCGLSLRRVDLGARSFWRRKGD